MLKLKIGEEKWREIMEKLNLYRKVKSEDLEKVMKKVVFYIQTEFALITKI